MKGICICIILFLMPLFCSAEADFEIKSECSSEKEIKRRVDVKENSLEICAVSDRSTDNEFCSASVISPWFGIGHLKTRGIFTEAMNPCGYSPTSEVFFEAGTLTLDRSISDSGTFGIFVRPFSWLSFFSLGNDDQQYIRGLSSSLSIQDLSIYLLLENSDIQPYSSESSWYLSRGGGFRGRRAVECIYQLHI